jgi:hypothetical protein
MWIGRTQIGVRIMLIGIQRLYLKRSNRSPLYHVDHAYNFVSLSQRVCLLSSERSHDYLNGCTLLLDKKRSVAWHNGTEWCLGVQKVVGSSPSSGSESTFSSSFLFTEFSTPRGSSAWATVSCNTLFSQRLDLPVKLDKHYTDLYIETMRKTTLWKQYQLA